jgi:hypothetical protein
MVATITRRSKGRSPEVASFEGGRAKAPPSIILSKEANDGSL